MKLRFSPTSPFVRKVMAVAQCTAQTDRVEKVPTTTADPDLIDDNPLGKVPAARLDDGTPLYDSRVICEFLDDQHAGAKVFPGPGPDRWRALCLQSLGDGVMDACVLIYTELRRPEAEQSAAWLERQRLKIRNAVGVLEQDVDALEGPLTIGGLTVGIALEYADRRVPEFDWRAAAPKLATWQQAFAKNDFMTATAPPPA